jgi:hypothetical protein
MAAPAGEWRHRIPLRLRPARARRHGSLRREPIEDRKAALTRLLLGAKLGVQLSEHLDRPGDVVFEHACKLGLEGIVSGARRVSWRSWSVPACAGHHRQAERDDGL